MGIWILYNVAFFIGYLLSVPKFLLRMRRRGGYGPNFAERFGRYAPPTLARLRARPRLWVHGVSVGEIMVVLRLIEEWRRLDPTRAFIVSTTTSTGRALAEKKLHPDDVLVYMPLDFPGVVRRALRELRPQALILAECELWPNLIRGCAAMGAPVLLVNGRISESSYRGYRRLRGIARRVLRLMPLLLVQTGDDRRRLLDLGADPAATIALGTMKYDLPPFDPAEAAVARDILARAGIPADAELVVGGSTWPGEERILMGIYRRLKPHIPALRLVLAPRHAERRDNVEADIRAEGLSWVRRTAMTPGAPPPPTAPDVLLADTTGELRRLYACASVIFVGKSLTQHGGQNIIEPAALGKPVIVGPNMENFPGVIDDFRAADAIVQVADAAGLEAAMRDLLGSPARRAELGRRAADLVRREGGVMEKSVRLALDALRRTAPQGG